MNIREEIEVLEKKNLSAYAALSINTRGRLIEEDKCQIRTDYQRDRDRIIHSKSFRRLKHKTQVFIAPEGDHFRTRLTHTLEVAQISRTIGRALGLNEDLIEAIALGHDLGHTPFGHTGERVLDRLNPQGFKHNHQSLKIVDRLETKTRSRMGLNLTYEVREGILRHSGPEKPSSLEGQVVRYGDRIAYINHDIDDALRAKKIREEDLPQGPLRVLGSSHSERINTMIVDIIKNSLNKDRITMGPEIEEATGELRDFMFARVYLMKSQDEKAEHVIESLYNYYMENLSQIPQSHLDLYNSRDKKEDIICDYIAGMTDRYVINKYKEIFIPYGIIIS